MLKAVFLIGFVALGVVAYPRVAAILDQSVKKAIPCDRQLEPDLRCRVDGFVHAGNQLARNLAD